MPDHSLFDIVKTYDVRGLVDTQLTPEVSRALGAAFVDVISGPGVDVVVGHDMRDSSPHPGGRLYRRVLAQGGGVKNIGLCSTDMVYFASGSWNLPAVMFTASHNPASYNGIKFSRALAKGISMDTGLSDIRDRATEFLQGSRAYGAGVWGKFCPTPSWQTTPRTLRAWFLCRVSDRFASWSMRPTGWRD